MGKVTIPEKYHSCLSSYETQEAIGIIKNLMQKKLCLALNLKRVTAPVFVDPASGLNDDLNGVEPVSYTHLDVYKRQMLYRRENAVCKQHLLYRYTERYF